MKKKREGKSEREKKGGGEGRREIKLSIYLASSHQNNTKTNLCILLFHDII